MGRKLVYIKGPRIAMGVSTRPPQLSNGVIAHPQLVLVMCASLKRSTNVEREGIL